MSTLPEQSIKQEDNSRYAVREYPPSSWPTVGQALGSNQNVTGHTSRHSSCHSQLHHCWAMAPEIQLGYCIDDVELQSATASSQGDTDICHRRTGDWILNLPSEIAIDSHSAGKSDIATDKNTTSVPDGWSNLPRSLLRGPAAEFKSHRGRWVEIPQYALKNNLLVAVGFLELANACDFAANVFNQVPIPVYAAVLMAFGGLVALLMLYFAIRDIRLCWINLKLLMKERRCLKAQLRRAVAANGLHDNQTISIQACIAVNNRELGFEIIDRFLLDSIMGSGCFLVGLGTLMAIGGNNPQVWLASNLLSGYIGNTPAALYGLVNSIWSIFIWFRIDKHSRVCRNDIAVGLVWPRLSHRHDTVKLHACIYGLTGLVAGAGSVMTATLWEGYVMLIPCVIASGWCSWLWRKRVGYGRPMFEEAPLLTRDSLIAELQAVALLQRNIKQKNGPLQFDNNIFCFFLEVIQRYDLMAPFCLKLHEYELVSKNKLFADSISGHITIRIEDILSLGLVQKEQIFGILYDFVLHRSQRSLIERERYLLELLGSYFYVADSLGSSIGN